MMEILLLLLGASILRLLPAKMVPHGAGVDQWFWRAYIEKLRAGNKFPPDLPEFRLDVAQWYPPVFPLLLAKAPHSLYERYAGQFAVALDLVRLVLLLVAAQTFSGSREAALVAGAVYALTPLLITYNMQLNPRGLGALFLDAGWLVLAAVFFGKVQPVFIVFAVLFFALVLLTHKMTTQLFAFTAVSAAALATDARLLLLIPGAMIVALIVSKGFYRNVLLAHRDILSFWFRQWRWSGSNPVLESPIYGSPGFESPSKYYRKGLRPWVRRLAFVFGFNPWMAAVLAVYGIAWWNEYSFSTVEIWVIVWLGIAVSFALLTTVVPAFRCLGQGYLYGYNASFPAALAFGLSWQRLSDSFYWQSISGVTTVLCLMALAAFFRALRSSRTMKVDSDLESAIMRLSDLPPGVVMCLPQHWHDVVAYRAKKPVAFGGHGFGFSRLAPVFPRFVMPVKEFIEAESVRYLLVWPAYVTEKFIADLPPASIEVFGDYRLYRFSAGEEAVST